MIKIILLFEICFLSPGTSLLFMSMFTLLFCIVVMNLLVSIAIADISKLMKRGNRDQLISQIDLITTVLDFRHSIFYKYLLPGKIRNWFDG